MKKTLLSIVASLLLVAAGVFSISSATAADSVQPQVQKAVLKLYPHFKKGAQQGTVVSRLIVHTTHTDRVSYTVRKDVVAVPEFTKVGDGRFVSTDKIKMSRKAFDQLVESDYTFKLTLVNVTKVGDEKITSKVKEKVEAETVAVYKANVPPFGS